VCLQPYIDGFEQCEYRFWCVAEDEPMPHAPRFTQLLLLKTEVSGAGITAQQYSALHPDTRACAALVRRMQMEHADFFERIYSLGVRCLRFDCGFNFVTQQPFFSEFASAPDGNMWSEVHQQDLAWMVGQHMADGICAAH